MAKEITEIYINTHNLEKFIELLKEMRYSSNGILTPYQTFSRAERGVSLKIPHSRYSPANNRYTFIHISSSNPNNNGLLQETREDLASKARNLGISITQYV